MANLHVAAAENFGYKFFIDLGERKGIDGHVNAGRNEGKISKRVGKGCPEPALHADDMATKAPV